jgi:hypothetical protein
MALKGDRNVIADDISFFMNEAATRGGVVSISTAGSGAAMDQASALVTYKANSSGSIPLGVLLNDMVDIDVTRQHSNQHKDEVLKGNKVTVMTVGYVVTNSLLTGITVSAGDKAYVSSSGLITNANHGAAVTPPIGRFLSRKDENGFAKVWVNLQ